MGLRSFGGRVFQAEGVARPNSTTRALACYVHRMERRSVTEMANKREAWKAAGQDHGGPIQPQKRSDSEHTLVGPF